MVGLAQRAALEAILGGGATGSGTVFQVKAAGGAARLIYSFTDGADGGLPVGNLIKLGGLLYGTAAHYGPNERGVVFSVNPKTRTESVVYSFQGASDGANLRGGLLNVGGTLYGTTAAGGATGNGTLFSVNPATGAETVLYSFQGGSDGANPVGELINADGTLYGTTISGGNAANCPSGCGTVFSYTP